MLKDIGVVGNRQGAIDVLLDDDRSRTGLAGCLGAHRRLRRQTASSTRLSVYSRGFETDFPPCYPGTNG
jgi:hypothetical protein